jgi:hypothetical protein
MTRHKTSFPRRWDRHACFHAWHLRWAVLLFSFTCVLTAQNHIGPFVSTVGTTWREPGNNRDWAYLFWIGNESGLVSGRSFALYSKSGDAASVAPFTRVSIVSLQTDARVIQPLLARATSIGDDTNALAVDIEALFGKFVAPTLPLAEKISAVLRGAMADENQLGRLFILARTHPSVAMALGIGHAEPIGLGTWTFEVREFDQGTQQDVAVFGRVTVQAGAPTVLPPPGAPVQVPSFFARGDMNIALRWARPDPLRRLSLLQHGFNVWRVMKPYAEAQGWHLAPPAPSALLNAYANTQAVWRLNRLPLLPSKQFTPADVANFIANSNTIFAIDDNDVGRPNAPTPPPGWTNGARFYYFVTPRDILGRDGQVSPGTPLMVCDQLPPNALTGVEVENDFTNQGGTPKHHLRLIWKQPLNSPTNEDNIVRYWLYRWTNANQYLNVQTNISNGLFAVVSHNPLVTKNSYLDNGPGSPGAPQNYNRTYWYTIRAEDGGACGGNLSPHSAPVAGTLRDRVGPSAPIGNITNVCLAPSVSVSTNGIVAGGVAQDAFDVSITAIRLTPRLTWVELMVEVYVGASNALTIASQKRYFAANSTNLIWTTLVPGDFQNQTVRIRARFGTSDGQQSSLPPSGFMSFSKLAEQDSDIFRFRAVGTMSVDRAGDCDRHYPANPDGSINPVDITVLPAATSRELRVYRRVNDGPLVLICQKEITTPLQLYTCQDDSYPTAGSTICWYAQTLDEHGNASPLTRIDCKFSLPLNGPPRPLLAPIVPLGDDNTPNMFLRWFCAPAGVKRFEVLIAGVPAQLPDSPTPTGLLVAPPSEPLQIHPIPKVIKVTDVAPDTVFQFKRFLTPRIGNGSSFGNGAEFTIPVPVQTGVRYYVMVKAVGTDDATGESSNMETFYWKPPPTNQLPTVAWPARSLPPVGNSFNFNFLAGYNTNIASAFTGAAVFVSLTLNGQYLDAPAAKPQVFNNVTNGFDPLFVIPKNTNGMSLFPMVMYRHQVPNARFPSVSGDVVQVSPMFEEIAYERVTTNGIDLVIRDGFVHFDRFTGGGDNTFLITQLKDTSPVVRGARYRYLLVRFGNGGEIAEVIPTSEMEVP